MSGLALFLFVLGLFFGSFLNVIIDRLPKGETFLKGRSHCEFCKHKLSWNDLIPVISFIILKGKCRYCKHFFGIRYPIIEFSTALFFSLGSIFFYSNNQSLFSLFFYLVVCSSLVVVFYIDLFQGIIPDLILLPLGVFSFFYALLINAQNFPIKIISGILAFLFFFSLLLITKGKGMGFGDVKLVFVMGLIVGFPGIFISIYFAFLSGAIVALFLMFLHKKKLKSTIAFGPFLSLGCMIALIWGDFLWKIVLRFFS